MWIPYTNKDERENNMKDYTEVQLDDVLDYEFDDDTDNQDTDGFENDTYDDFQDDTYDGPYDDSYDDSHDKPTKEHSKKSHERKPSTKHSSKHSTNHSTKLSKTSKKKLITGAAIGAAALILAIGGTAVYMKHSRDTAAALATAEAASIAESESIAEEQLKLAEAERTNQVIKAQKLRELQNIYSSSGILYDIDGEATEKLTVMSGALSAINSTPGELDNEKQQIVDAVTERLLNDELIDEAYTPYTDKLEYSSAFSIKDGFTYKDYNAVTSALSSKLAYYNQESDTATYLASVDSIPDEDTYNNIVNERLMKIKAEEEAAAKAAAEAAAAAAKTSNDVVEESSDANEAAVVEDEPTTTELLETKDMCFGIDVSHYQSDKKKIDWAKVKASGMDFVIIKCGGRSTGSDGTLYTDKAFEKNIEGALANGLQVGIYFFSQAINTKEAAAEAEYCINLIKKYNIIYPVAFDWESAKGYRVAKYKISKSALTSICTTFADKIADAGYTPMIYFCRNDWYNIVDAKTLTSKYKVWLAMYYKKNYYTSKRWTAKEPGPDFKYKYDMWQYGVTNTVDGIEGYVDMDVSKFSYHNYEIVLTDPYIKTTKDEYTFRKGHVTEELSKEIEAMNCIGISPSLSYSTNNSNYYFKSLDSLQPGTHTIRLYFNDPKYGGINHTIKLNITY